MARSVGTVRIDVESCKGCELCIPVCPPRVLEMSTALNGIGFRFPVLLDGCTGCELCAEICPDYCFEVYRAVLPPRSSGASNQDLPLADGARRAEDAP